MNHLRELLEALDKGLVDRVLDFPHDHAVAVNRITRTLGENAMCFYGGEISNWVEMRIIEDEVKFHLPFQISWFEFSDVPPNEAANLIGALVVEKEGSIIFNVFKRQGKKWLAVGSCSEGTIGRRGSGNRLIAGVAELIKIFIMAMSCVNVTKNEHVQPEKLQTARMKRGKKPLFSYWTLELKLDRTKGDPLGGTHASPRLHLRRGHARQFAPGQWTWIQPCIVGKKSLGMVHKDYTVVR